MPASGWRSVGASVREEEYFILMERLKELGFENLQQLVKALIHKPDFTSKIHDFTSKRAYPTSKGRGAQLETNGGSMEIAGPAGVEPATTGLKARHSTILSYGPTYHLIIIILLF